LLPWVLLTGIVAGPANGADRFWDVNGTAIGRGGTGTWDLTSPLWSPNGDGVSGPYSPWNNGALDDAFFGDTAGTVTLGEPITVHNIIFETNGYVLGDGTLTLDGVAPTIVTNPGVTTTINSIIAGSTGLTKDGTGTLSLTGVNTFAGDVDINTGRLIVNGDPALGNAGNMINMAAGARLDAGTTGGDLANRTVNLVGTGDHVIAGAGVGSAFFTGAGSLNATGSVNMSNDANDYTGRTAFTGSGVSTFTSIGNLGETSSLGAPTTVADGTIFFGNSSQTNHTLIYVGDGDTSDRNWQINPGSGPFNPRPQLRNGGTGTLTLNGDIALGGGSGNGPQFYAQSADLELLGVISSNNGRPVTFLADAGRIVTLGDANTFTGISAIGGGTAGGTVQAGTIADIGVASSLGTGSQTNIGGNDTLSYTGTGASSDRNWNLSNGTLGNDGSGALTLSGDMTIANTASFGGSFTGADNIFSGVISGNGNLRSGGDAIWVLTGTNAYTGDTIVDGGTLRAGSAQAFGDMNDAVVTGGILDLNDIGMTFPTLSGDGGTVDLGSATLTLEAAADTSATYAGSITGSGGLTKLGASSQTLTGASTYTGDTTIAGGALTLDFSAAGAPTGNIIGSSSALNMSGGVLNVIGADGTASSQNFGGLNVTAGNNVIDVASGAGGSTTLNLGAITRTGGFMDFNLPDSGSISTSNADMPLSWATVNGTDYAKVEGGLVLAFDDDDYTDQDDASLWMANQFISDDDGDADGFFGTLGTGVQLGGLRYTQPIATTVTVAAGQTLGVDANIIVAPSVAGFDQLITGGMMTGAAGGILGVQQNSDGNFTIASQIVDNGGSIGFTKSGTGLVTLSNASNSYTGPTRVSQGTLAVSNIGNGGAASGIGAASADPSNLVFEGSTLRYTGATTTSDRGFTIAKSGAILGSGIQVTDPSANLTFSGLVTSPDDANFTKSGPGTLTLANPSNDYVGTTTVTGGLLSVNTLPNGGVVSPIGQSSSDPANLVLNGGGLQYTGATTSTDRGFTLEPNDGTVDVTAAGTELTVSGTIEGAGTLIKEGDGTLILDGTTNYTGGNIVNGGVLRAGGDNTLGAFANVGPTTLADAAGVTLDLAGFDNLIGPLNGGGANGGNVTLGDGTLRIQRGNGDYSGVISGTGGIHRTAGGTQTFNGCNNTYTGSTLLQGANVSTDCLQDGGLASGIGASNADSANLQFINGALIYTGGSIAIDRGFELVGGVGNIQVFDAATTLEFEGAAIGGGSLIKSGPGTLVLSGANTYTGNTRVTDGVLRAAAANAFGPQGEMTLDNSAGVLLDLDGFDTVVSSLNGGGANGGNIDLGSATLTILDGVNRTYAGVISGSGNLVKNGTRIQALSGCNSDYTGSTTINAGTLQVTCLEDGGASSSIGAATSDPANLVIDGGTLNYVGTGGSTDREFTLGTGGGTIASNGSGAIDFSFTGPVTLDGTGTARTLTLTGDNTGLNIFSAQLDDDGAGATSLTKTGDGRWRLTNANSTYTGITTISGGILEVDEFADGGMASSIGAASSDPANLVIGNGSTLRYTGAGDTSDRRFTLDEGVTFIESSGSGPLQFTNTGAVGLTGTDTPRTMALGGTNTDDNTFGGAIGDNGTGATTLAKNDNGTWVLTGNNTFTGNTVINDGNLIIGNGGTTGNAGAGNVIVDSPTSTLSLNRSDTFTFDGTLSGPGTLAQIGMGTSVLTSADNEIGATTISAGTLEVDGGLTTPTVAMTGTAALTVGGTVQAAGAGQTAITGDAGAQTVNVNAGGTLLASGDLGGGSDSVTIAGALRTGTATLDLGTDDDTLVLNDGAAIDGAGADGGAGTDLLQVNNANALTLSGASVDRFERLEKLNTGVLTLTADHAYPDGTTISAGTLQVGDGGTSGALTSDVLNNGTLAFNRSDTSIFAGVISGAGTVRQIGSGLTELTGDSSGFTGMTSVETGTLAVNGRLCGDMNVLPGGRLQGIGSVCTTTNAGVTAPGNSIGTLTVVGNYTGNDGTLEIETELGDDSSPTDRLVVTADTAGATTVRVINVGGTGAPTVEGIKIIDVGGASNGVFTLQGDFVFQGQPAVIGGAYAYVLEQNGVSTPTDGDWYLRSSLQNPPPGTPPAGPPGPIFQPGVPVFESYPLVLLGLTGLPTLRQRVGDRYWSDGSPPTASTPDPGGAAAPQVPQASWARVEGQRTRIEPKRSTTVASLEVDQFTLQAGLDGLFLENGAGRLFGGFTLQYGQASAAVRSLYGDGTIRVDGYSFGGTLTWSGWNGLYVDGQAQATWHDSKLTSSLLGRIASNSGFGHAVGVEAGMPLASVGAWSLTPQAQLIYASVDLDSFTDPFGARVSLEKGDSLTGRLGLAADYELAPKAVSGRMVRPSAYGIADLYYEFLDETDVEVSATRFANTGDRLSSSAGIGGSVSWNEGRFAFAVYGEVAARASLANLNDTYSYKGTAGLRIRW
jgi:fibronectin-binding autotransporter adhesin